VVAINCVTPNQTTRKYVIVLTAYFRRMVSRAQVWKKFHFGLLLGD